jgi:hypothetical protein
MGEYRELDGDSAESQSGVKSIDLLVGVKALEQDARRSRTRDVYEGSNAGSVGGWRQ